MPPACHHEHRPLAPSHDHDHGHHHHHHAAPADAAHRPRQRRALWICVVLTAAMMVVEAAAGLWTHSLMLLSDALHMLSHAGSLGVSLVAIILASRVPSARYSFGLYRIEIVAALLNGLSLAAFCLWIVWESAWRLIHPAEVLGLQMTAVAVLGLAVNLATAAILGRAGLEDLNTRSAFLHMLADTISSVAIVIGGIVIIFTHWWVVDPLLSLVVAVMVGRWSWGLLRDSLPILLERGPRDLDPAEIEAEVRGHVPEVRQMHDVHLWEITSQYVCLSAHVVVEDHRLSELTSMRERIGHVLQEHFGIAHAVLEMEG